MVNGKNFQKKFLFRSENEEDVATFSVTSCILLLSIGEPPTVRLSIEYVKTFPRDQEFPRDGHRAFGSSSVFRAFARSLSFADSTSDLNRGLTSLLLCPFLTILTLSLD